MMSADQFFRELDYRAVMVIVDALKTNSAYLTKSTVKSRRIFYANINRQSALYKQKPLDFYRF